MRIRLLVLVLVGCVLAIAVPSDAAISTAQEPANPSAGNVLLLIADDLGIEASPCAVPQRYSAPRLASFCDEAVVFTNVWSSPICSPTRAGILTGRHSFRTGIGEQATRQNGLILDAAEITLPEVLGSAGYATANIGKWHLGGDPARPNAMGWDHFSGLLQGGLRDYFSWQKTVNGEQFRSQTYATTDQVNDAIDWIDDQTQPWLAWVAFNAPHTPFHAPPADLHSQQLSGRSADIEDNPGPYFAASIEALDAEIGRLIDSLDPAVLAETTIIFVGDNGTSAQVSPHRRVVAKGSLNEGGVHVPMMIWGASVDGGRRTEALVGTVDLFATILDLAGVDARDALPQDLVLDSVSFAHLLAADGTHHEYLMSELFGEVSRDERQGATIRDDRYKLIAYADGRSEFFDLLVDPASASPIATSQRTDLETSRFDALASVLSEWTADADADRPSIAPAVWAGWWQAVRDLARWPR